MSTITNNNRKDNAPKKRRPPEHQSRVEGSTRPRERTPVSGHRDILTVLGQDPGFVYRWVSDKNESGRRITRFLAGGWNFVEYSEDLGIGADSVYNTENVGSIVRLPEGSGSFLYLMNIKKEWYDEDQAAKADAINATEKSISRRRSAEQDDGMYGDVKLSTKSFL